MPGTSRRPERTVRPDEQEPAGSLASLLAQVGHVVGRGFRERLQPLGLEPRQYRLLRSVGATGGRSQQAVANDLGIPPSRMVVLVDGLEARGLLERYPNPSDRRAHALRLSGPGRKLLAAARPVAEAYEAEMSEVFAEGERAQLVELLGRVATRCETGCG